MNRLRKVPRYFEDMQGAHFIADGEHLLAVGGRRAAQKLHGGDLRMSGLQRDGRVEAGVSEVPHEDLTVSARNI